MVYRFNTTDTLVLCKIFLDIISNLDHFNAESEIIEDQKNQKGDSTRNKLNKIYNF